MAADWTGRDGTAQWSSLCECKGFLWLAFCCLALDLMSCDTIVMADEEGRTRPAANNPNNGAHLVDRVERDTPRKRPAYHPHCHSDKLGETFAGNYARKNEISSLAQDSKAQWQDSGGRRQCVLIRSPLCCCIRSGGIGLPASGVASLLRLRQFVVSTAKLIYLRPRFKA